MQTVDDKPMSRNRRANRHNNNRVAGVIDVEPGNLLPFEPDIAKASAPAGGKALLIGLVAFIPPRAAIAAGHTSVDVGYGRVEAGGWFFVRHPTGQYDLQQVAAELGHALVAIRSIRVSPFQQERQAVYFAGYDTNKAAVHDTAWILRSTSAVAGAQPR